MPSLAPWMRPGRPRPIRRVPNPRMSGLLDSPVRNLRYGALYTITISLIGITAYMSVGWNFRDALYMVITTVFTVGYGEVRPINIPAVFLQRDALYCVIGKPLKRRRLSGREEKRPERRFEWNVCVEGPVWP